MLLGRAAETARISALIAGARGGDSGVLVIRGEPGIGKTALLEHAREQAAGLRILATRGTDAETEIPYVHLADLLGPVAGASKHIPSRQAAALAGVLALGPAVTGDRFAVAAATMSLLGALAGDGPTVILIDDVQWIDRFSLEVLAFVGRRLRAESTLVLATLRLGEHEPVDLQRFDRMTLDGLADEPARRLIASTGQTLAAGTLSTLLVEAAGNPLALLELPALLAQRGTARSARPDPLPLGERLEDAFGHTLDRLPAECFDALLLLAVFGSTGADVYLAALAAAGMTPQVLDPAEQAHLVVDQQGRLAFRHPLVRAAVHHMARASRRQWAHGLAAQALADSSAPNALERRAFHLVAAGHPADDPLAQMLELAADGEYRRSNFAAAGNLFTRSSEVGEQGPSANNRLLRAADATRLAGGIDEAKQLLERIRPGADAQMAIVVRYFILRIAIWRGDAPQGVEEMRAIAAQLEPTDPVFAALVLTDAALACVENGRLQLGRELAERAGELSRTAENVALGVDVVRAFSTSVLGDAATARELLDRRAAEVDAIDPLAPDLSDQLVLVAAIAHLAIEDVDRADQLLGRAVTVARDASAVGVLPFRLGRQAWVHLWQGRWASALTLAAEGAQLADDTGWVNERPNSLAALARVEAATGREQDCRAHAALAVSAARDTHVDFYTTYTQAALGLLAVGAGDYDAAAQHLARVAEYSVAEGLVDTPMLWWSGDLIESYVAIGEHGAALKVLARLEEGAGRYMSTAAAVAARCRALLEPADFDRHIAAASGWHARAAMPFEQGRTQLVLGSELRRRGHSDAGAQLAAALTTFDRLGATRWSARAREELTRTGVSVGSRAPHAPELTPQELQVALGVARGMSNREVAAHLFLSVKTVEFHLRNTYHKLGIKRRAQLAVIIAHQDPEVARWVTSTTAASRSGSRA